MLQVQLLLLLGSSEFDYMFSLTDGRNGKDRAIGIRGQEVMHRLLLTHYASGYDLPFTNTSISADTWYHVAVVFTSGRILPRFILME